MSASRKIGAVNMHLLFCMIQSAPYHHFNATRMKVKLNDRVVEFPPALAASWLRHAGECKGGEHEAAAIWQKAQELGHTRFHKQRKCLGAGRGIRSSSTKKVTRLSFSVSSPTCTQTGKKHTRRKKCRAQKRLAVYVHKKRIWLTFEQKSDSPKEASTLRSLGSSPETCIF